MLAGLETVTLAAPPSRVAPPPSFIAAAPSRLLRCEGGVVAFAGDGLDREDHDRLAASLIDVADDEPLAHASLEGALRRVRLDVVAVAVSRTGGAAMLAAWTGVPPLYLYRSAGLWACSDNLEWIISAVQVLGRSLTLDVRYVARFITAIAPPHLLPEPEPTAFQEVRYLPGAHVTRLATATATAAATATTDLTIRRYWRYWQTEQSASRSAPQRIRNALVGAVGERLPGSNAGILLSGGLDSSCVAAATHLSGATTAPFYNNAFTCAPSLNETLYARAVATHLAHPLTEIPSDDLWAFRDVPDEDRSTPPAEPYQAWFFAQERAVAHHALADGVDVIFDGFGGDELFQPELHGGSFGLGHRDCHVDRARHLELMRQVVHGARDHEPLSSLVVTADPTPVFLTDALADVAQPSTYLPELLNAFAVLDLDAVTAMRVFMFECTHFSVYDRIWANRDVYNGFGIRRRQPFFDRRVVEAVFSAPIGDLLHGAINKPLLRRAMRGTLPSVVLNRRHKVTFEIMERRGIGAAGAELPRLRELMRDAMVYELGLVNRDEFLRCFEEVYLPDRHERLELPALKYWIWQTLTLEVWLRQWSTSTVFKPSAP
jgi:asparagine synthetase B (glutamine-hydrolysing)